MRSGSFSSFGVITVLTYHSTVNSTVLNSFYRLIRTKVLTTNGYHLPAGYEEYEMASGLPHQTAEEARSQIPQAEKTPNSHQVGIAHPTFIGSV